MAVAASQAAVVLTNDLDLGTILAARGHSGPSVIQLRGVDLHPEVLGDLPSPPSPGSPRNSRMEPS
jgi:predicted nuclease of predicted toxin-antitoxin system